MKYIPIIPNIPINLLFAQEIIPSLYLLPSRSLASYGYTIKVKVQTLNSNQNATLYKNYTFNANSPGTISNSHEYFNIDVPSSGVFVIQVQLLYSECTWQNTNCTNESASKKEFFKQQTFQTSSNNYYFDFQSSDIIDEDCGC